MVLDELVSELFRDWSRSDTLPDWLGDLEVSGNAQIKSTAWEGESIRRARLCQLSVPEKFSAETLVIYPSTSSDSPVFGCEYLRIGGKKFFGGVDFHPLCQSKPYLQRYIERYLGDLPETSIQNSKFYDLRTYFSKRFWMRKDRSDFYGDFLDRTKDFLVRYRLLLSESDGLLFVPSALESQRNYDLHMGLNDPAQGILKAYFSESFAELYIRQFLFDLINDHS
jgi:hypothetical protein